MLKHFSRRRTIHNRLHSAPDNLTVAEVTCYTGCRDITVRKWLELWKARGLVGPNKIAIQQGNRWLISRERLIIWLIAGGRVNFSPEYGYPDKIRAREILETLSAV